MRQLLKDNLWLEHKESWDALIKADKPVPREYFQKVGAAGLYRVIVGPPWAAPDLPGIPELPLGIKNTEWNMFHELIVLGGFWEDEMSPRLRGHRNEMGGRLRGVSNDLSAVLETDELRNSPSIMPSLFGGQAYAIPPITKFVGISTLSLSHRRRNANTNSLHLLLGPRMDEKGPPAGTLQRFHHRRPRHLGAPRRIGCAEHPDDRQALGRREILHRQRR